MEKKIGVMLCICFFAGVLSGCGAGESSLLEESSLVEDSNTATSEEGGSSQDIFADNSIVDLGSNCIAYPVPNGEIMSDIFMPDENFTGDRYIAIYALDFCSSVSSDGDIYYLPDVYGNITEMKMEESGQLYLQYEASASGETEEVRIPFYFPARTTGDFLEMDDYASYEHYKKQIQASQKGLLADEETVFPQTVWTEVLQVGDERYEAVFERVSPIYNYFVERLVGYSATYRLTVKDEKGDVVWEQMMLNYPAAYEEPHWFVDFTGDGYLDIALCTYVYWGKAVGWSSTLRVLIWNPETSSYEESKLPEGDVHLWNEGLSSMIVTVDNDKEMYSYLDGEWKMVRRLQAVYSEDETYNGTNESVIKGFHELFYSEDGNVVEERMLGTDEVWNDDSVVWSSDNEENLKLYPDYPL